MRTVRHWKRSYKCDHTARDAQGAVVEALRCARVLVPAEGVRALSVVIQANGRVAYPHMGADLQFVLVPEAKKGLC